jgi:hypothetical protein
MGNQKEPTEKVMNWFVEPEDAQTNEVLAKSLLALSQLDESVALLDSEGEEHSVFQVEAYSFVTRLYKDMTKFHLHFKVFYRSGTNGPLRLWKLGADKPKPKLEVKAKPKGKNPKS